MFTNHIIHVNKLDLALNNPRCLICHKTNSNLFSYYLVISWAISLICRLKYPHSRFFFTFFSRCIFFLFVPKIIMMILLLLAALINFFFVPFSIFFEFQNLLWHNRFLWPCYHYYIPSEIFMPGLAGGPSLSDSTSPLVSITLLSILTDLNNRSRFFQYIFQTLSSAPQ